MPHIKYNDESNAELLSDARDYCIINQIAVKEMHRQLGDLEINRNRTATRGLLIQHLVLPCSLAGTKATVKYIKQEISDDSYINIVAQYKLCHKAFKIPELAQPLLPEVFSEVIEVALAAGLKCLGHIDPIITKEKLASV